MSKRSVSMADVAHHAGVSPQTVSRVANDYPGVVPSTRDKVLASMEELRYRPNSAARALKRGSFKSLGVVLPGLRLTGNHRTLEGIVTSADEQGYSTTIKLLEEPSDESLRSCFQQMAAAAVDGVILALEIEDTSHLYLTQLPYDRLVVIDSNAVHRYPVVDTNQRSGTQEAVNHLLELGHSTVHHVSGPLSSFASSRRLEAWREALIAHGKEVPEPIQGDWSVESGFQAGIRIAEEGVATAVFVSNDEMALGFMRGLGERGVNCPADVSVVGFDDIPLASNFPTPLTTVHQNFDEVGRRCVSTLIKRIEGGTVPLEIDLVPTTLIVRDSTARARR